MPKETDEAQNTSTPYGVELETQQRKPTSQPLQMQSENLLPYAVPGDVEQRYGPPHRFDPLPQTGKLRLLAHMASIPPTREVLQTLQEQTELALLALRKPEGRRNVLLDQLQVCEAAVRWLLGEANKQPRMASKLVNAAMAVQSNLARLVVLLDQTEGRELGGGAVACDDESEGAA